jgi:hypothetical protein
VEATDLEANPEEKEAVAKQQEVSNEEAAVETIGALKDRSGDRRLAVRRRGRLKKLTQGDGGSWQKWTLARGWLTRRSIPALRKGRIRRESGKTTDNSIRG